MAHHCVEDGQELAHAGGEGDLVGFACRLQALVEGANRGLKRVATRAAM
jgi:hypothetical protein